MLAATLARAASDPAYSAVLEAFRRTPPSGMAAE